MIVFVVQSLLLLSIAFVLGVICGAIARMLFAADGGSPAAPAAPAPDPPTPVPRAPAPAPAPDAEAAEPVAASPSAPAARDDLKKIKGIGPQNERKLNQLGITRFAQIAAWTAADAGQWGERLAFPGRIEREDWIAQARALAGGAPAKGKPADDEPL